MSCADEVFGKGRVVEDVDLTEGEDPADTYTRATRLRL